MPKATTALNNAVAAQSGWARPGDCLGAAAGGGIGFYRPVEATPSPGLSDWDTKRGAIDACAAEMRSIRRYTNCTLAGSGSSPRPVTRVFSTGDIECGVMAGTCETEDGVVLPPSTVERISCDCSHKKPWSQGGQTNLTDLELLCRHHHRNHHMSQFDP